MQSKMIYDSEEARAMFERSLAQLLERHGVQEIRRHAQVSINTSCRCNRCFTCFCLEWIQDFDKKAAKLQDEILAEIEEEENGNG